MDKLQPLPPGGIHGDEGSALSPLGCDCGQRILLPQHSEYGSSMAFQNDDILPYHRTSPQPKRTQFELRKQFRG